MNSRNALLIEQAILAGAIDSKTYTKKSAGDGVLLFETTNYYLEVILSSGTTLNLYNKTTFEKVSSTVLQEYSKTDLVAAITALYTSAPTPTIDEVIIEVFAPEKDTIATYANVGAALTYALTGNTWKDGDYVHMVGTAFKASKVYTLEVILSAITGFEFKSDLSDVTIPKGAILTSTTVANDKKSVTIVITFPATAA